MTIIDCIFSRNDVNSLIQNCDCLVSLHRSEGFGLTLGEAMYLGKPVIATAYSGNVDFTLPGNSFLVSYQLRPVGPNNEPYDAQCHWADPSIEDAARHMRTVFEAPGERARIAAAGQAFVREQLSPAAVGAQMKRRIEWLHNRALRQML